ncbi:MAG: pantetheine-phosphate adenylyltransferase [Opitutae bacterium]|jgi:pantetheine-phosphate adenylyltransferase|nr:pantetheine-phosphate adenylyltransferase [Opitutae bacterium]|tara:strand:+ start:1084 stop:1581 length:498 start_codon:yes stop_codon:yes gene_type:complete
MNIALYPGSFDPITNGHLDILQRARKLFDQVIVAVAENAEKDPTFSLEERKRLVEENVTHFDNVSVESFNCLLVDHAQKKNAVALVRGLRAVSDFEYEFQMAQMNRHLDPKIETVFLMPNEKYFFTSSHLLKLVNRYGGEIDELIPANALHALRSRFAKKSVSEG